MARQCRPSARRPRPATRRGPALRALALFALFRRLRHPAHAAATTRAFSPRRRTCSRPGARPRPQGSGSGSARPASRRRCGAELVIAAVAALGSCGRGARAARGAERGEPPALLAVFRPSLATRRRSTRPRSAGTCSPAPALRGSRCASAAATLASAARRCCPAAWPPVAAVPRSPSRRCCPLNRSARRRSWVRTGDPLCRSLLCVAHSGLYGGFTPLSAVDGRDRRRRAGRDASGHPLPTLLVAPTGLLRWGRLRAHRRRCVLLLRSRRTRLARAFRARLRATAHLPRCLRRAALVAVSRSRARRRAPRHLPCRRCRSSLGFAALARVGAVSRSPPRLSAWRRGSTMPTVMSEIAFDSHVHGDVEVVTELSASTFDIHVTATRSRCLLMPRSTCPHRSTCAILAVTTSALHDPTR